MSLAGLTIFLDRLSTTKTDTVLFFLVLSYLLQIEHIGHAPVFHWRWPLLAGAGRRHRPVFSAGAVQLFSLLYFLSLSEGGEPFFKGELIFWSGGGLFLWGEDVLLFFSDRVVFLVRRRILGHYLSSR